ncbi:protein Yae1p [[Candida] anglica]|uniref:Protein YAE1 n=1 Tax=[Candida] anglica TaxID=148631 RepID=A0ABP0E916_9ASCO
MGCGGDCQGKNGGCGNEIEIATSDVKNFSSSPKDSTNEGIWADNDNISSVAAIQRAHTKQGYLDGLSQAKESSLQQGFDEGYPVGGAMGVRVGAILAQLSDNVEEFNIAKNELNITKILDKKYFDNNVDLVQENHPILEKWEQRVKIL